MLEKTTHHKDLAVGRYGCDRLTNEEKFTFRVLLFSIVLVGQKLSRVFNQAFLEYVGGEFFSVFILVAIFVFDFSFVIPYKVVEVNNHQGVRLETGLGNQVEVLDFEVGTTRNKFGYSISY